MADWTDVSKDEHVIEHPFTSVLWAVMGPHKRQAELNHGGQSLETLAQRGGLCRSEAVAVLEDRAWNRMSEREAAARLDVIVAEWEAKEVDDDTPEYVRDVCVPVVKKMIMAGMSGALTPGTRCLMHYPQPSDIGCFYHPAATGCGPWGFMSCTVILFYGKRHNEDGGPTSTGRSVTESAERFGHPCSKPILAWTWLVNKVAGKRRTVFDPFLGSGTTLRASKDLGLLAAGCDVSERYCEIAANRLRQEVLAL